MFILIQSFRIVSVKLSENCLTIKVLFYCRAARANVLIYKLIYNYFINGKIIQINNNFNDNYTRAVYSKRQNLLLVYFNIHTQYIYTYI